MLVLQFAASSSRANSNFMTHTLLDFLRSAVVQYGYWAVAATLLLENMGVPLPGETILLIASFAA